MQASIPSIFGQMIVFFLFVFITMKYIWPPITKALEDRRTRIAEGLAAAEKGARSLQDASAKSEEALKEARAQAQEILANANKQAVQLVEQAKGTAQTEAERIVARAQAAAPPACAVTRPVAAQAALREAPRMVVA